MRDAHGVEGHAGVAKDENRRGAGRDIVRLQLVGSLGIRLGHIAEIAPGSVRIAEEVVHKLGGGGHVLVSRRAVYGQGAGAISKPGRKDQSGEVATVIDMEVAEEEDVELGEVRATLAKAESAASARVDDHTGFAVIPDEIAGGGALVMHLRAAGAEYLHREAGCAAGLRRCGRGCVCR